MKNIFNLKELIRPTIAALKPYSSARDEFTEASKDMIFLDANENPFENGVNRYPDPQQRLLKQKLSDLKQIPVDQILLGNGSDEVLDLIFRAFCEPGKDNVITLPPTYGMYSVLAGINAIVNKEILLTSDFEPDVAAIKKAFNETSKVLFLCMPNNPTGNSFSEEHVIQLLNTFNGLVVIDEAYIDFSTQRSWIHRLAKYPNLIVTQTLSKAYGMAGIRLGICYASSEIISILNKIKPPYNVNDLTQQKALEQLQNSELVYSQITAITKEKDKLSKVLLQIEYIETVYPSEANFLLVKVDDARKRYDQLIAKGIVIRNRSSQPLCKNTLRLTIGTEEENNKLFTALKALQ